MKIKTEQLSGLLFLKHIIRDLIKNLGESSYIIEEQENG